MQFTRLRLSGFKSFVDPTELVIEHGLTGVVGPNGCGKSNLLEALRWVMGENRPTAMRGDGMEDVIFAGSSARPARSHAEVVLRIDNTARRAPAALNAQDELEVSRRITRALGSVFRVNGKEARARDVQLLFADAASGAASPSLVRQGQIAELINARPKARRRVLEEAAGISGLYARRHEAELKLRATEANLARVGDVIDALEVQIASLVRQARAAARYREVAEALRRAEALHLLKVWHEAEADRAAAAAALTAALTDLARAEAAASRAARARDEAGEALPARREEEAVAGAVLQRTRLESAQLAEERERAERRIADLRAALEQVGRDEAREAALDADAGETLAVLGREREALEQAGEGETERVTEARAAAVAKGEALAALEREADGAAEWAVALGARHEAARRAAGEAKARLEGARRGLEEAARAQAGLGRELAGSEAALGAAGRAAEAAAARAAAAELALRAAEEAAQGAAGAEGEARSGRAAAEGEAQALAREHRALAGLLARERPQHAPMLDRVAVEPGYERAVGAAFGDDLGFGEGEPAGWRALEPVPGTALPEGATGLAAVVGAPEALARRLAAVGVVGREDGPRLQAGLAPGQRLVSREGDLWRWDGLSVPAGTAQSGAALRLEQRNRLAALAASLGDAEGRAASAIAAHEAAAQAAATARAAEAAARAERRAAEAAATEAARMTGRAEAARDGLAARVAGLEAGLKRRRDEIAAAEAALAAAEAEGAALAPLDVAKAEVERIRRSLEAARAETIAARSAAEGLARAAEARATRLSGVAAEMESWTRRRGSTAIRLADLARRRADAEGALEAAEAAPGALTARGEKLATLLRAAEARHRAAADALAAGEAAAREAEAAARSADRSASDAREARARGETRAEAAGERLAAAAGRVEAETGTAAPALAERLTVAWEALPDAAALAAEAERLTRARDALGAVNLRAEEDAKAAEAERDALAGEKADLDAAIAKLRHGIAQLNREGRGRLLAAFDEVNARFGELFRSLFGGGEASLVLVDSDDPLDAGLEIMAQPPGKKLATLSLLSGGEQTLTALALIFAVFLSNPAPICVLDEVDAPLDDANVQRFCDLLDEMRRKTDTRFLIITHHAVTMARMDRLFGVTMVERGVSQLVSVDLAAAERMVEPA